MITFNLSGEETKRIVNTVFFWVKFSRLTYPIKDSFCFLSESKGNQYEVNSLRELRSPVLLVL